MNTIFLPVNVNFEAVSLMDRRNQSFNSYFSLKLSWLSSSLGPKQTCCLYSNILFEELGYVFDPFRFFWPYVDKRSMDFFNFWCFFERNDRGRETIFNTIEIAMLYTNDFSYFVIRWSYDLRNSDVIMMFFDTIKNNKAITFLSISYSHPAVKSLSPIILNFLAKKCIFVTCHTLCLNSENRYTPCNNM